MQRDLTKPVLIGWLAPPPPHTPHNRAFKRPGPKRERTAPSTPCPPSPEGAQSASKLEAKRMESGKGHEKKTRAVGRGDQGRGAGRGQERGSR